MIHSPRLQSALDILGCFATCFTVYEYQCNPDHCGHSDSIILRAPGYIAVCFSLEELQKAKDSLKSGSNSNYCDWVRSHFLVSKES